jgi:class 3 adenylate cyclase
VLTTMLFTDIVSATRIAFTLGDRRWHELLLDHHALVRAAIDRFRGREVDNAGDGFFATFDGPGRAVDCACHICAEVPTLGLAVRAGLHTGECEIIGHKPGGIAVHIASRIVAEAAGGEVLVSSTVRDVLVGSQRSFEDRGMRGLRGLPGKWRLFAVREPEAQAT